MSIQSSLEILYLNIFLDFDSLSPEDQQELLLRIEEMATKLKQKIGFLP